MAGKVSTFLILLLLAPATALAAGLGACESRQGSLDRYADLTRDGIQKRCEHNLRGAKVDELEDSVRGEGGRAAVLSACGSTYAEMKNVAEEYRAKQKSGCAEIQKLTQKNDCSGAGARACYEQQAKNLEKAAEIEADLAKKLKEARNTIAKKMDENRKRAKKYKEDQKTISFAKARAKLKEQSAQVTMAGMWENSPEPQEGVGQAYALDSQGNPTANWNKDAAVVADNGGASDISGYDQKIALLAEEQEAAAKNGDEFRKAAESQETIHDQRQKQFQREAFHMRALAGKMGDSSSPQSGISGTKKETPAPAASHPTKSPTGTNNTSVSSVPSAGNESLSPTAGNDGSAGGAGLGSLAGAGTAAGAGMGAGSGGSSTPYQDPYAYMPPISSTNNQQSPAGTPTRAGAPLSGTATPGNGTDPVSPAAPIAEGEAPPMQDISISGFSGGLGGSSTLSTAGASRSPAGGKRSGTGASRTAVSTAAGSGAGKGPTPAALNATKEVPSLAKDLSTNAVSIGGGDLNAALSSLAEDFGLTTSEAPLTEAEQQALSLNADPSLKPDGSAATQANDVVAESNSAPLFVRTKWAHERAVKRGDLILGLRKRL